MNFKTIKIGLSALAIALTTLTVQAQQEEHKDPNVRMGQKALLDGDFKTAVTYLEKAIPTEGKDPSFLYLLGYSEFQSADYAKAAVTFGKIISLEPNNANAYYYKAKANNTLAVAPNDKLTDSQRLDLIQSAIVDYTKAVTINKNDAKLYQNRAIAYRDLGILRSTEGIAPYNKVAAIDAYNKAITDFEKVLAYDASRKDIQAELKKAKVYRDLLK